MRYRTAASLVALPAENGFVIYNFISKDVISCPAEEMFWLTDARDWLTLHDLQALHSEFTQEAIQDALDVLTDSSILLLEGSDAAHQDNEFRSRWHLGPSAALFHFTTLDCDFMDAATSTRWQVEQLEKTPEPPVFFYSGISSRPFAQPEAINVELLALMTKRRSVRQVTQQPVTQRQIGDILYSGMGITGWAKTDTLQVPLKMTPSGGARNPYEAFVWIKNCDDAPPGIYHYSAFDNAITWLRVPPNVSGSAMVQSQDWANDMAAVIFLVAMSERTTWKYQDDNAYKVMLIEAGHIAQNMMLTATSQDLTVCPTAALNHKLISQAIGLKSLTHFPVYALLVGHPSEQGRHEAAPRPYVRNGTRQKLSILNALRH